jgi:hypothetical protein
MLTVAITNMPDKAKISKGHNFEMHRILTLRENLKEKLAKCTEDTE